MNRRQTIVLWIMAVALSLVSILHGLDWSEPFYMFVVPIVLLGGMLVFQFRDRRPRGDSQHRQTLRSLAAAIVLLQIVLLAHQFLAAEDLATAVASVDETVERAATDISLLEGEVQSCQ